METITATSVTPERKGYKIVVNRQLSFGRRLTADGIRLKRIIEMLSGEVRRIKDNVLYTTHMQGISTTETFQAKLDSYAHKPMNLTFGEPKVTVPELQDRHLDPAAAPDRYLRRVTMWVRGDLPLLNEDCEEIRKLTRMTATRVSTHEILLTLDVPFAENGSPWQRMIAQRVVLCNIIV